MQSKGSFVKSLPIGLAALVLCLLFPAWAHAATVTWTGDGDGTSWEDGNNWDAGLPGSGDDVIIESSTTVDIGAGTTVQSLSLDGGAILNFDYDAIGSGALVINGGDLTVNEGASVTHTVGTSSVAGRVNIEVQSGDATIDGDVDVSSKGYAPGEGSGAGVDGAPASGGSYGGKGGMSAGGARDSGDIYDSANLESPSDYGSGGGLRSGQGGFGGGSVLLDVSGTLTVNGSIAADGQDSTRSGSGGGAGGSIYLIADSIVGTGVVSVNGGIGLGDGGEGGGGRLALLYTSSETLSSNGNLEAYGAVGSNALNSGGAGTIFIKDDNLVNGNLIIDNNDENPSDDLTAGRTYLDLDSVSSYTFDTLELRNYGSLELNSGVTVNISTLTWNDDGLIVLEGGVLNDGSSVFGNGADVSVPDGAHLVLTGTSSISWGDLTVAGELTHSNNEASISHEVDISLSGDLSVSATGSINVDGRGYEASAGSGAGTDSGLNATAGGGSYGGEGGDGVSKSAGNVYGSVTNPTDAGSGGGLSFSNGNGSGGGILLIDVSSGSASIEGTLSSNGTTATQGNNSGGGSGGSINITANSISGSGSLLADGGDGRSGGGGGGGGRIALNYSSGSIANLTLQACGGGDGTEHLAGAGTIYTKAGAANGDLTIDNCDYTLDDDRYLGLTTLPSGTYTFDTVNITGKGNYNNTSGVTLNGTINWDGGIITDNGGTLGILADAADVTVDANDVLVMNTPRSWGLVTIDGLVTHSNNDSTQDYTIDLTAVDLNIGATGSIDVDEKGYRQMNGPGAGTGNNLAYPSGASHGGEGGRGRVDPVNFNGIYGSVTAPETIGSGGGVRLNSQEAGRGGGAIKLTVSGALNLDGTLSANAGDGVYIGGSSGGAGGSIWIDAEEVSGAGTLTVNGGDAAGESDNAGSGGGGGRLAFTYVTGDVSGLGLQAYGGNATLGFIGGAGTIFVQQEGNNGDLTIDNSGQHSDDNSALGLTVLPDGDYTVDTLTVSNAGVMLLDANSTLNYSTLNWSEGGELLFRGGDFALFESGADLTVPETAYAYLDSTTGLDFNNVTVNGTLSHSNNLDDDMDYALYLNIAGNLVVGENGSIDVTGKGHPATYGDGAGSNGNTAGGGGYGGVGGDGTSGNGGTVYGEDNSCNPFLLGSGGGTGLVLGGSGGGAVRLNISGNMTLNGDILADGLPGSNVTDGGGSGGSIYITTNVMRGAGNISANGADRTTAGAGGGGRIALAYTADVLTGTRTASAGSDDLGLAEDGSTCTDFTNSAPSVSNLSATELESGSVQVSFDFTEPNLTDSGQIVLKYNVLGEEEAFEDLMTLSATAEDHSSTYGSPSYNIAAEDYQIGDADAYVIGSSGTNSFTVLWNLLTDLPSSAGQEVWFEITAFDGELSSTPAVSSLVLAEEFVEEEVELSGSPDPTPPPIAGGSGGSGGETAGCGTCDSSETEIDNTQAPTNESTEEAFTDESQESSVEVIEAPGLPEINYEDPSSLTCGALPFADVSGESEHFYAIYHLWCNDIVHGRKPSIFAPDAYVLRGEVTKVVARLFGYVTERHAEVPNKVKDPALKDVERSGDLGFYIEKLVELDLIDPKYNEEFGYNEVMESSEINELIYKVSGINMVELNEESDGVEGMERDSFMTLIFDIFKGKN